MSQFVLNHHVHVPSNQNVNARKDIKLIQTIVNDALPRNFVRFVEKMRNLNYVLLLVRIPVRIQKQVKNAPKNAAEDANAWTAL